MGLERLTSLEVTAIPPIVQAFKRRPMVFLNACEVGRPTVALAGIGGFAAAFLDLGASAVIAPLRSVKDTIAYKVAEKFYEAAVKPPKGKARKGFAERMREIRALAYDAATGEDTYAAYCFYGDPNASAAYPLGVKRGSQRGDGPSARRDEPARRDNDSQLAKRSR